MIIHDLKHPTEAIVSMIERTTKQVEETKATLRGIVKAQDEFQKLLDSRAKEEAVQMIRVGILGEQNQGPDGQQEEQKQPADDIQIEEDIESLPSVSDEDASPRQALVLGPCQPTKLSRHIQKRAISCREFKEKV